MTTSRAAWFLAVCFFLLALLHLSSAGSCHPPKRFFGTLLDSYTTCNNWDDGRECQEKCTSSESQFCAHILHGDGLTSQKCVIEDAPTTLGKVTIEWKAGRFWQMRTVCEYFRSPCNVDMRLYPNAKANNINAYLGESRMKNDGTLPLFSFEQMIAILNGTYLPYNSTKTTTTFSNTKNEKRVHSSPTTTASSETSTTTSISPALKASAATETTKSSNTASAVYENSFLSQEEPVPYLKPIYTFTFFWVGVGFFVVALLVTLAVDLSKFVSKLNSCTLL